MKYIFTILALFFLLSCAEQEQQFLPVQIAPGNQIPIELQKKLFDQIKKNPVQLEVGNWIKKGKEFKKISRPINGVIFKGVYEDKARQIIKSESGKLKAQGYYIYLTNLNFDKAFRSLRDIAIVKGYDKYDLLKIYDVSGPNYDITNQQVIDQIKSWEKYIKIDFIAFEFDRFEGRIRSINYDISRLAKENYKLCPDVIEQGYETMDKLEKGLQNEKYIWCWWD